MPFHGGNTGSIPVGRASNFKKPNGLPASVQQTANAFGQLGQKRHFVMAITAGRETTRQKSAPILEGR